MIFNRQLGAEMRHARPWTLQEVEKRTNGEFKASVVGAYERGERAMTVARFVRLCEWYSTSPILILDKVLLSGPDVPNVTKAVALLHDVLELLPTDQS